MAIDTYAKSVQLLERIANSVYERDQQTPNLLCFNSNDVLVVQEWIKEFLEDMVE